jgi:AraC-like DNA-binding protein
MKPIPIMRGIHLSNFLKFLRSIGAPVERGLHQVKLPIQHVAQLDSYLPAPNVLAFFRVMSHSQGVDDLGLRAVQHIRMDNLCGDFLRAACQAPTLCSALQAFCRLANHETTYIDFWMSVDRSRVRIFNFFNIEHDMVELRCSEWVQNFALVEIIRAFAGPQWLPTEMAFQSNLPISNSALETFPNTRFLVGQKTAWVDVPLSIAILPPTVPLSTKVPETLSEEGLIELPLNFSGTLKLLVKPYLADGYLNIHGAAEIAGTSTRTLQRHLAKAGLSYSQLIQQVRLETSMGLLKDRNIKVMDAAFEVGYTDPSNFARAFRSFTGLSPQEYRRHQAK